MCLAIKHPGFQPQILAPHTHVLVNTNHNPLHPKMLIAIVADGFKTNKIKILTHIK